MDDEGEANGGLLVDRVRASDQSSTEPRQDLWSKVNIFLPLITAIAVAVLAFFLPNIFNRKELETESRDEHVAKRAQEIEVVEKFFPHLTSNNESEKQAAIELIYRLDDKELALTIATIFGGPGANGAVANISATTSGNARIYADKTLSELYGKYGESVGHILVNFSDGTILRGTCVLVNYNGMTITAASYFPSGKKVSGITVSLGSKASEEVDTSIVKIERNEGIAILKLNEVGKFLPAKISENPLEPGTRVVIMGYTVDGDLPLSESSTVESKYSASGKLLLSTQHKPGLAGSPLFDRDGAVIGIIIGASVKNNQSLAMPVSTLFPLAVSPTTPHG
jgi:hypothetical protein